MLIIKNIVCFAKIKHAFYTGLIYISMYNKYAIHYDATKNSSFFHCKDTKTQRKKYILLIINSLRLGAFAVKYY